MGSSPLASNKAEPPGRPRRALSGGMEAPVRRYRAGSVGWGRPQFARPRLSKPVKAGWRTALEACLPPASAAACLPALRAGRSATRSGLLPATPQVAGTSHTVPPSAAKVSGRNAAKSGAAALTSGNGLNVGNQAAQQWSWRSVAAEAKRGLVSTTPKQFAGSARSPERSGSWS